MSTQLGLFPIVEDSASRRGETPGGSPINSGPSTPRIQSSNTASMPVSPTLSSNTTAEQPPPIAQQPSIVKRNQLFARKRLERQQSGSTSSNESTSPTNSTAAMVRATSVSPINIQPAAVNAAAASFAVSPEAGASVTPAQSHSNLVQISPPASVSVYEEDFEPPPVEEEPVTVAKPDSRTSSASVVNSNSANTASTTSVPSVSQPQQLQPVPSEPELPPSALDTHAESDETISSVPPVDESLDSSSSGSSARFVIPPGPFSPPSLQATPQKAIMKPSPQSIAHAKASKAGEKVKKGKPVPFVSPPPPTKAQKKKQPRKRVGFSMDEDEEEEAQGQQPLQIQVSEATGTEESPVTSPEGSLESQEQQPQPDSLTNGTNSIDPPRHQRNESEQLEEEEAHDHFPGDAGPEEEQQQDGEDGEGEEHDQFDTRNESPAVVPVSVAAPRFQFALAKATLAEVAPVIEASLPSVADEPHEAEDPFAELSEEELSKRQAAQESRLAMEAEAAEFARQALNRARLHALGLADGTGADSPSGDQEPEQDYASIVASALVESLGGAAKGGAKKKISPGKQSRLGAHSAPATRSPSNKNSSPGSRPGSGQGLRVGSNSHAQPRPRPKTSPKARTTSSAFGFGSGRDSGSSSSMLSPVRPKGAPRSLSGSTLPSPSSTSPFSSASPSRKGSAALSRPTSSFGTASRPGSSSFGSSPSRPSTASNQAYIASTILRSTSPSRSVSGMSLSTYNTLARSPSYSNPSLPFLPTRSSESIGWPKRSKAEIQAALEEERRMKEEEEAAAVAEADAKSSGKTSVPYSLRPSSASGDPMPPDSDAEPDDPEDGFDGRSSPRGALHRLSSTRRTAFEADTALIEALAGRGPPPDTPLGRLYLERAEFRHTWEADPDGDIMSMAEARDLFKLIDGLLPICHDSQGNDISERKDGLFDKLAAATKEAIKISQAREESARVRGQQLVSEPEIRTELDSPTEEDESQGHEIEEKQDGQPRLLSPANGRKRLPPLGPTALGVRRHLSYQARTTTGVSQTHLTVHSVTNFAKTYARLGGGTGVRGFGSTVGRP